MEVTPKSAKRKMKQESPTVLFDNSADTIDVSYEFLSKTKMRGASTGDCQIPLGQRPNKFIKSPNLHVRTPRITRREKKIIDQKDLFQRIFKDQLDKSGKENEDVCDSDDSLPITKDACEGGPLTTLFDDSSNDIMVELSQQVEKDEVIEPQNISGVNCDVSFQLPVPDQTVSNRNLENRHSLKHSKNHDYGEKRMKRDSSLGNKISKLSANKFQKTSVHHEKPGNVRNNTSRNSEEDFRKQYNLLRERRKVTPDILDFVSMEFNQTQASLLLEDGNDAGFFELDETTLSCSNTSSTISLAQKCTPQEIETKRREALKKLQEKKMKAKQAKR